MAARERGTPFKRNYSDTEWREPGEGYNGPEPQKGLYPFTLVDVREHESSAGNDSIHWTFEATADAEKNDENYAGWRGHIYTNDEGAKFKEQQVLVALGAIKPNGSYSGTLEGLLKKYGKVVVMGRVIRERYTPDDGGEGEWRAKLTTILRPRADTPGAKTSRQAVDDEEEYTDEEVEERTTRAKTSARRRGRPAQEPEPEEVDEETEEEDEEARLDALQEELEGMSLVALKKLAKEEYELSAADLRGLDKDDVIEKIMDIEQDEDAEEEPEEDEEEEEPPPPPKRSATNARAKGPSRSSRSSSRTRSSRTKNDDEPPF